jgi:ribosomal protein L24, bacterial/organelle
MQKTHVKKEDFVLILTGADKGKTAKVIGVDKDNGRVLLEGKNLNTDIRKAVKARKASDKGGLIDKAGTIDISNVLPICSACGKATKVGHKETAEGKLIRICKKCGAELITKKATAKKAVKADKAEKTEKQEGEAKATVRRRVRAAEVPAAVPAPEPEAVTGEKAEVPAPAEVTEKEEEKENKEGA